MLGSIGAGDRIRRTWAQNGARDRVGVVRYCCLGAQSGAFFLPAAVEIFSSAPIKNGRPGFGSGGKVENWRPILARWIFGRRRRRAIFGRGFF